MITVLVFQVLTSLRGLSLISLILVINKQAGTLYYMTYVKPLHDISSYHESVTCLHNMLKLIDFKIKFDCNVSSISSCTEKLTLRYMHYLYSKLVFESLSFIRLINELVTHGRQCFIFTFYSKKARSALFSSFIKKNYISYYVAS